MFFLLSGLWGCGDDGGSSGDGDADTDVDTDAGSGTDTDAGDGDKESVDSDLCVPDPCHGHGTCGAGLCTCDNPYMAADCGACLGDNAQYPDCILSPVWVDEGNGVMWQNISEANLQRYDSAVDYCANLQWEGYDDWRLPKIDELVALVRGCVDRVPTADFTASACGVSDPECLENTCSGAIECLPCPPGEGPGVNGCYWPAALGEGCVHPFWSSSIMSGDASRMWLMAFEGAALGSMIVTEDMELDVRCVWDIRDINTPG